MNRRQTLARTACAALAAVAPAASAHQGQRHTQPPAAVAPKEQKPWGVAGDRAAVRRTVTIAMTDTMRFTPDRLQARLGETLRIVARNDGKMLHEIVIGTRDELDAHAALMKKHPNMEHDEPYMAHVDAGKAGEIVWRFNRAGTFWFACLIPGHYEAGMIGRIDVLAR